MRAAAAIGLLSCLSLAGQLPAPGEYHTVVNGVRLYYRVAGGGDSSLPPVVFLHGGPGYNSYSFSVLAGKQLEPQFRMVYLDQRGSGRSERPWDKAYSIDLLVEDLEALRRQWGTPRLALIGHSFGGTLALEYAAKYPARVARMVIADGLSDAPASVAVWLERLRAERPDAVAKALSKAGQPAGECAAAKASMSAAFEVLQPSSKDFFDRLQFRDQKLRQMQDDIDAKSGLTNTGELTGKLFGDGLACYRFNAHGRLTMPVLVIGGRYDGAIGLRPMRELAEKLPNAKFLEYENSAHFPYVEEPERFERDVKMFLLQKLEPETRATGEIGRAFVK